MQKPQVRSVFTDAEYSMPCKAQSTEFVVWLTDCVSLLTGPGLSGPQRLSAAPSTPVTTVRIPDGWCFDATVTALSVIVCCREAFVRLQPAELTNRLYHRCGIESDGQSNLNSRCERLQICRLSIYIGVIWEGGGTKSPLQYFFYVKICWLLCLRGANNKKIWW
jgi:hypothetical protein